MNFRLTRVKPERGGVEFGFGSVKRRPTEVSSGIGRVNSGIRRGAIRNPRRNSGHVRAVSFRVRLAHGTAELRQSRRRCTLENGERVESSEIRISCSLLNNSSRIAFYYQLSSLGDGFKKRTDARLTLCAENRVAEGIAG